MADSDEGTNLQCFSINYPCKSVIWQVPCFLMCHFDNYFCVTIFGTKKKIRP